MCIVARPIGCGCCWELYGIVDVSNEERIETQRSKIYSMFDPCGPYLRDN